MQETVDHPTLLTDQQWQKEDFCLVIGGPLFQILRRTYLSEDALELLRRRIFFLTALAWLPLLCLSVWEGIAWTSSLRIPFLLDVGMHIRFLLIIPTLLVAEWIVHQRMRPIVRQFIECDLIPGHARAQFDAAVVSALRLRNSVTAEVLLLLFAYAVSILVTWRTRMPLVTNWYAQNRSGMMVPSWAGTWLAFVSVPLLQFLFLRWFYRLAIWVRMLWQI